MPHRKLAGLVGVVVAATLVAGCIVDPRYQDRRYGRSYNRPHDQGYDYGYDPRDRHRDRDDYKLPTIVCASKDGRPNRCRTDFRISRAEVDKRYSGSPCEYGRTWGYDGNEIWVDRGCRARFVVTPSGRWR
jgi:hypothetical protein